MEEHPPEGGPSEQESSRPPFDPWSQDPPQPKPRRRRLRLAVVAIIAIVVAGAAAVLLIEGGSDDDTAETPGIAAPPQIRKTIATLSLAQKADQVVIAGFDEIDALSKQLGRSQLGGVFVGPDDWPGAGGSGLIARIKGAAAGRVPPLIVGRQEGGIYRSYPNLGPADSQSQIGGAADPALAESSALSAGRELRAAGFDLNLAPVADIATLDSPIGDRAFSDDPDVVTALTQTAVRGCGQSGIACAATHFPGLGAASDDPGAGPATVSLDPASLEARDLSPFRAAIAAKVPALVLSLASYAAYDPVTPAALSPAVASDLLREQLKFKGVAIADDLTAGAITAGLGPSEAAVQALAAGVDLVLVDAAGAAGRARGAILKAARSGGLPSERLDQAAARVLQLKARLGLLPEPVGKEKKPKGPPKKKPKG